MPTDRGDDRILLVGPKSGSRDGGIQAADPAYWDPTVGESVPDARFALVICAEAIHADQHPADLLLGIWEAMKVGGKLLLHSRVLADPKQSMYARFGSLGVGADDAEWLPGRLALRWTVETNGFDIERWIDAGLSAAGAEDDAYLVATRSERTPGIVLSTPVPVDTPDRKGETP
ncbi:MAG TPA: hypothetical protein VGC32_01935 [Solirubrobacterales bacterium]